MFKSTVSELTQFTEPLGIHLYALHCNFISYRQKYTDKKENKIFLIYKEIQMGSGAKSFMRKGASKYMRKCANLRKPLVIYDYAPDAS